MRSDKIFDMIGKADDKYIADAKKRRKPRLWAIPAAAVLLVCAISLGAFVAPLFLKDPAPNIPGGDIINGTTTLKPTEIYTPSGDPSKYALLNALYPESAMFPNDPLDAEAELAWNKSREELNKAYSELGKKPSEFIEKTVAEFLRSEDSSNIVYSPINVYMALSMLAETAGGESREQLLSLLGEESIEELRASANAIFKANYADDGAQASILASSLWLAEELSYNEDTLKTLADDYFASSFSGEMGSEEYNEALRTWLNEQTGGLLSDSIKNVELCPEDVLAIATTVYFNARWSSVFNKEENTQKTFYGKSGETVAEYMNKTVEGGMYYRGDGFTATTAEFGLGGSMYFILPNEGVSTNALLSNDDVMQLIYGDRTTVNRKAMKINMSIPKFDVSSDTDLVAGLKNLGVTDIFNDAAADFTPLTDIENTYVSSAKHAARVTIDEEGCTAAAYTLIMIGAVGGYLYDEIDFVLDRPFIFVITSDVGLPLFVGVVNNI